MQMRNFLILFKFNLFKFDFKYPFVLGSTVLKDPWNFFILLIKYTQGLRWLL